MGGVLRITGAAIAALVPIMNPLGGVAAFAALSADLSPKDAHRQAWRTAINVFAILAVFALVGSVVLKALGISLPALQIAGGLVVAHSGFAMLSPRPQLTDVEQAHANAKADISFSPMALPLIAGPGAIGVMIGLGARHPGLSNHLGLVGAALVMAVVIGVALRYGTPVVDRLGPAGIGALTRVMGFLILAIGVELFVHGVRAAQLL
jgi:multiple antibiotic resistance protein